MPRNWLRSISDRLTAARQGQKLRRSRRARGPIEALEPRVVLAAPSITGTPGTVAENIGVNTNVQNGFTNTAITDSYVDPITGVQQFNTSAGTYVGNISATANDVGEVITNITQNNFNATTSAFRVIFNPLTRQGEVYVNNWEAIDFEENPSITFSVTITDNHAPNAETATANVTINVADRNDIPYLATLGGVNGGRSFQEFTVDENSVTGTVLTGVTGTNAGGIPDTYTAVRQGSTAPVDQLTPNDPSVSNRSDVVGTTDSFEGTKNGTLRYQILGNTTSTATQGVNGVSSEVQRIFKPHDLDRGQYVLSFASDIPMSTITQGNAGTLTTEVQQIDFGLPPTSGFYTLTFKDTANPQTSQTTRHLSYTATAAQVQAELQALPNLGANNVTVKSLVDVTQTTKGGVGVNEVQTLTLTSTPKSGFFFLTFNGQTTAGIAAGSTAAQVQSALESLTTIGMGNVSVANPSAGVYTVTFTGALAQQDVTSIGNVGGYTVTFAGALSASNQNQLIMTSFTGALTNPMTGGYAAQAATIQTALRALPTVNGANLTVTDTVTVTTTTQGVTGMTDEVQHVVVNDPANTPTFRLTFSRGGGNFSTVSIASDATAAEVESALEDLPNIGTGNVTVTGGNGVYDVTFTSTLGQTNVSQMTSTEGWLVNFSGALANLDLSQMGVVNTSDLFSISNDRPTLGRLTISPTADPYMIGLRGDGANGLASGYEFFNQFFGTTTDQIPVLIRTFDRSGVDILFNTNIDQGVSLTYDEYVLVTINDVSEVAPVVQDETFTISESAPNGSVVGKINDINNVTVVTTTPPGVATNEVQTITATTTAPTPPGTFALRFNGQTTPRLSYNATAQEVENALRALTTIGSNGVSVTRTTGVNTTSWQVTFTNNLGATDVPQIEVVNGTTDLEAPPQIFRYTLISGNTNNAFAVNQTTGEITVNNSTALDFETGPTYRLLVQVQDVNPFSPSNSVLSTITAIDINLTDFNEATTIPDNQQLTIEEGAPVGTQLGSVSAFDLDRNATLRYTITNGNTKDAFGNDTFSIDVNTGVISVNSNLLLNSVTNPFFDLEVRVTDDHIPITSSATNIIRVNVVDVNQSPPIINDYTFTIPENRTNGFLIGTLAGITTEANQTITYSIINGTPNSAPFTLNASTGQLRVSNPPGVNFESVNQYTLLVKASDSGSPSLFDTAIVTIYITDQNEQIDIAPQTLSVAENSSSGTVVGTVVATDPDDADGLAQGKSFSIVAGNTNNVFSINASSGQITVNNPAGLNFESLTSYQLAIQVSDVGLGPQTSDVDVVTINVTNVNDAPVLNDQTLPPLAEHRLAGTVVGSVVVTDQDTPPQTFTYQIIGGNVDGAFQINAATGQISVANPGAIDFAQNPVFNLTVQVTDSGSPALSDTGIITINLVDGNPPIINDQTFSVNENSTNGTVVGNLGVTGGTIPLNFSITSITPGAAAGAFVIDAAGNVVVNNSALLDFETTPTFTLSVMVTDNSNPQLADNAVITINLINLPDSPPTVPPQTFSVLENSSAGTSVGTVMATDPDVGSVFTYQILSGNTGGAFSINSMTGEITVSNPAVLDFETNPVFTLTVQATDNGVPNLSASGTVTINLQDANDPPVIADQTFNVVENSPAGTFVGQVLASDVDPGQTLMYSFTAGNQLNGFKIDANTGMITVNRRAVMDNELYPQFSLTVAVMDSATPGAISTATITINVTDVNEAPLIANQSFMVQENSPVNTVVGDVVATDPDPGQTLSYSITGGNVGNTFAINASTGRITVANLAGLDFETNPVFSLTVTATDSGSPATSSSATVTINLTNQNELPVIVQPQTLSVAENSSTGTIVGTVQASDPDANTTLTYSIMSGNTSGAFSINSSTGQITVNNPAVLDFETTPTFSLVVKVQDNGSPTLSTTGTVTINLTDQNDPATIPPATFQVAENSAAGTFIGQVAVSDPDPGQIYSYRFTSGNQLNGFKIDAVTGVITVNRRAVLDFETSPQFVLQVAATDNGSPALTAFGTVTINLIDQNENAPVVPAQSFSIAENTANNTVVGTVSATDADPGQTLTYAITAGNTNGAFSINATTGQIRVANAAALNFESQKTFALTVTATDNGTPVLTGSGTVTINLTDVNEGPTVDDQTFTVPENTVNGNVVAQIRATDPDLGQTPKFAIISGNVSNAFSVDPNNGNIRVNNAAALNFEVNPTITFTVRVTDSVNSALTDTAVITINLTNQNDAPKINAQTFTVKARSPVGTAFGTVQSTDEDVGQTRTYSITGGNAGGAFTINASTGVLTVANRNSVSTPKSIPLTVTVRDNGTGNLQASATITVNVTNSTLVAPSSTAAKSTVGTTNTSQSSATPASATVTAAPTSTATSTTTKKTDTAAATTVTPTLNVFQKAATPVKTTKTK